jgi:hypothetical protein
MKRAETPEIKRTKRKSPAGGKQQGGDSLAQLGDRQDLIALKRANLTARSSK